MSRLVAMSSKENRPDATLLRRALDAEREAREDTERAKAEARELVEAARARVRSIERRAEDRIASVSRVARAETERRVERLVAEERSALARLEDTPEDRAAIDAAARSVASGLTADDSTTAAEPPGASRD